MGAGAAGREAVSKQTTDLYDSLPTWGKVLCVIGALVVIVAGMAWGVAREIAIWRVLTQ